jgi:hypothetical protein
VRYTPLMKWFRLETQSGNVARVSVMLMGLPEFAGLLLQNAPQGAIAAGTVIFRRRTGCLRPALSQMNGLPALRQRQRHS